jgi:two-component SAPR family response regulator
MTRLTLDDFKTLIWGKKVVLMYPRIAYRNIFLAYFLQCKPHGFLYHCVPDDARTVREWLTRLVTELPALAAGFGTQLAASIVDAPPEQLGNALAADLAQVSTQPVVLYLDELDRIYQDNDFQSFIRSLVAALPDQVQLAINTRVLTYYPWIEMVERQEAAVLGTEFRRNQLIFTPNGKLQPQLEIQALGQGDVWVNGHRIENWDGALPRNLFFYFVDNPLVTRDQIFETFWPKLNKKEATNVFHVTKRKIIERIGEFVPNPQEAELTKFAGSFYVPSSKIMRHYDVADFENALEQAPLAETFAEQEKLYQRAISIYRASFLTTIDMPWVIERRKRLEAMLVDALIGMGQLKMQQEYYAAALGFFTRALREAPGREDIHRQVMITYWKMGRKADTLQQYRLLEAHLAQTIGVRPSRDTRELFEQFIQDI